MSAVSDVTPPLPALDVLLAPPGSGPGAGTRLEPTPDEEPLAALYAVPSGPHVRANMVASVDGGAWGPDHRSGSINDAADWRVFRVLRALADVVLVGAGTARAEGYTSLDVPRGLEHLRAGRGPLELAVVTRSGHLPPSLAGGDRPPFVITDEHGAIVARACVPADRVLVVGPADAAPPGAPPAPRDLPSPTPGPDLRAGLAALADRGLGRVLCEGGPHLLADLLALDLLDELCVTTTPVIVGPGPGRIVGGLPPLGGILPGSARATRATGTPEGPAASAPPVHPRLAHLLHADGTLVARWALR
ncbi:dihydrofolate reductase family protein [Oerskovia sp. Sa1BUA8]|uniref:Dihydrofolate reductase family protein n=1 Tax=Oerskovia douganii TaxID=2762210 RepID=A0A9D5UAU3_9CELL|nr:dihydrofolate reductase family protein [Oerskovia douganii]MBE7700666.1 dihydrofolate reductase family protein [Oerskovia douganii]